MGKKKLKRTIRELERKVAALSIEVDQFKCHCENYKPKTVEFRRWQPLPPISRVLIRTPGLEKIIQDKEEVKE